MGWHVCDSSGRIMSCGSAVLWCTTAIFQQQACGHSFPSHPHLRPSPSPCRTYLPWAHAKGLVHFNASAGFWLRHSTPVWPNQTDSNPWWSVAPTSQTCNGQYAICLSLTAAAVDGTVAALLSKFKPYFYQASGLTS